jgi:DNA-binding MarR family transcriptional regulator
VTRLVDGLVADSLAHRKADPRDRRRVLVHITRRGLAPQRQLSERIAAERDAILAKSRTATSPRFSSRWLALSPDCAEQRRPFGGGAYHSE